MRAKSVLLIVLAALLLVGVGVFVVTRRSPRVEKVVVVVRLAGRAPSELEQEVAVPLELDLGALPHLRSLRSVASRDTVRVECTFDAADGSSVTAVRERLTKGLANLPREVEPPIVETEEESLQRLLLVAERLDPVREPTDDLRHKLEATAGVARVETCGPAARDHDHLVVRIDLQRMSAFDLETRDVEKVIDEQVSPLGRQEDARQPAAIGRLNVREGATPIRVSDIATVSVVRDPPSCMAWREDGSLLRLHLVRARRELDQKRLDEIVRDAGATLEEGRAAATLRRASFRFPPATFENKSRATEGLIRQLHTRLPAGALAIHAIVLRATARATASGDGAMDDGEIFFTSLRAESAARLEEVTRSMPDVQWRGVHGDPNVHRVVVTAYGDDLDRLEASAKTIRTHVDAIEGIHAYVGFPFTERVHNRDFKLDRQALARSSIAPSEVTSALAVLFGESKHGDLSIEAQPPGQMGASYMRIRGRRLDELARMTDSVDRPAIVRMNRRRAIELAWEVDANLERRVLGKVKGALEGVRDVTIELMDAD